jgi:purine-binding chemotaxis protein CheW
MRQQRFEILPQPRPPEEPSSAKDPLVQLCAFFVGEEEYAVDIQRVAEILPPQPIIPIRGAPAFIEGVIHHERGAIIPVVSLRKLLLGPEAPVPKKTRMLVCLLGRRRVAFVVDRVTEVVRLRRSEIKPTPALGAVGPTPFIVGVYAPERPKPVGSGVPERARGRGGSALPERSRPGGSGPSERLRLLLDVKALLLAELVRGSERRGQG